MSLKKSTKVSVLILLLLMAIVAFTGYGYQRWFDTEVQAKEIPTLKEQLEEVKAENEELKVKAGSDLKEKIVLEIKRIFGKKAPEALKIISCENNPDKKDYDPYRININKNASSLDYGVFQINSLWEKVYGSEFKKNWKANIQTAKKIFDRSGDWRMWYSSDSCHNLAYK